MRKFILIPLLSLSVAFLSGCSSFNFEKKTNDDDLLFNKTNYDFVNLTSEYSLSADSFDLYFKDGSDVPYISISDYLLGLDGLFDCGEHLSSYSNDKEKVYCFQDEDYSCHMAINWYDNYIYFDTLDFISFICKETESTDYEAHFKLLNGYGTYDQPVKFDLDRYYFDIYNYQDICLVPLCIINTLLGSNNYYNLIFNGEKIYGYYGEISDEDEEYNLIYRSSYNNKEQSKEMREAAFNSLCFNIDYFFGLKDDKRFSNYSSYINKEYKNNILSLNPSDNMNGYMRAIISQLDDLHSRVDSGNIYCPAGYLPTVSYSWLNEKWFNYYEALYDLKDLKVSRWGENTSPDVRYIDNTAIITLNSFKTAPNDVIYDKDGNVNDDAYLYDTYWYMDHVLKDIGKHNEIENVILDLSCNGGGNVGALIRAFGFLTDEPFTYTVFDTLVPRGGFYTYEVDANDDGSYLDDAYDQYNWTLLTSERTYSAANTFASLFKENNVGKIIGQKSGGGMCSVLPIVLADSTFLTISSNNTVRQVEYDWFNNPIFVSIENGIAPDIYIPHSEYFNDTKLNEYVNQLFN